MNSGVELKLPGVFLVLGKFWRGAYLHLPWVTIRVFSSRTQYFGVDWYTRSGILRAWRMIEGQIWNRKRRFRGAYMRLVSEDGRVAWVRILKVENKVTLTTTPPVSWPLCFAMEMHHWLYHLFRRLFQVLKISP